MTVSASDLKVVDVDAHLSEPWDLWTKRAPKGYEDRVPRVKMVEGENQWVFDTSSSVASVRPRSSITRWRNS